MRFRIITFLVVIALVSCVSDKDYNFDSLSVSPTLALPLAYGQISILDLISDKDSAYLKVYPDGLLYFSYYQTLASQDIRELFKLQDNTSSTSFDVPPGTLPPSPADIVLTTVNKTIDMNLSPEQLSELLLKTGSINYSVSVSPVNPNLSFEINVTLTDVIDKTSLVPMSFTAAQGAASKPLQNYIIKMNNNKFNVKLQMVLKKKNTSTFIAPNTKANITLSFTGLDFTYMKGFLGDQSVALPTQSIDLTAFSSSLNKSKISFVQPVLTMSVSNGYGVPCQVSFNTLEAKKTGATLPIQISPASPVNLNFPSVFGTSSTTAVSITNATAVMNFSPTQLSYSANARINKGLTTGVNFLTDTSKLKVTMTAEVPLYGQASGITMIDTLSVDLGSINQSSVFTAALKIKTVNEMPLDANIQLFLADKNYIILDSLFTGNQTSIIKGSSVTGAGELQTAGTADQKLDLSSDKINKLFSSSYLIIRCRLNTSKDKDGVSLNVKFKSSYKLKINVGLFAKMNITVK